MGQHTDGQVAPASGSGKESSHDEHGSVLAATEQSTSKERQNAAIMQRSFSSPPIRDVSGGEDINGSTSLEDL